MTTTSRRLCTLCFETQESYETNLETLLHTIQQCEPESIILASEVCLTGFDYKNFDTAATFSAKALETLCSQCSSCTLILTVIEKEDDAYYNCAKVIDHGKIVHEQRKSLLFGLGEEDRYFTAGNENDIAWFDLEGIRIGILICFELRFKRLWQQLEGADIIVVPARWGKIRAQNFQSLTNALAIMNQCYVMASDASNEDATGLSGIITPFGEEHRNSTHLLCHPFERQSITKMRRYLDIGIHANG